MSRSSPVWPDVSKSTSTAGIHDLVAHKLQACDVRVNLCTGRISSSVLSRRSLSSSASIFASSSAFWSSICGTPLLSYSFASLWL